MRSAFAALLITLTASSASASPQGIWPDEARHLPMGRPSWVLVVPAVRGEDGRIQLWDRFSPWSREWVVPRPTPSGIRTVSISGDSEDQKLIRSEQLDNMSSETLRLLAGKYGAAAVAVVVEDSSNSIAVAVWKKGGHATWEVAQIGDTPRSSALAAIDVLFGGTDAAIVDAAAEAQTAAATIIAQRLIEGGAPEYRLKVNGEAARLVATSSTFRVTGREGDLVDVMVVDGRDIESALLQVGVSVQGP